MQQATATIPETSPFSLTNSTGYLAWRSAKLAHQPASSLDLMVEIQDARQLSDAEKKQMQAICRQTNIVLYRQANHEALDKAAVATLGEQFGLHELDNNLCADEDAITPLAVHDSGRRTGYIPYTNRPLSWHTDGYYNAPEQRIRAWSLHCVRSAETGGENCLMDHEMVYILLRDENPDMIEALLAPDAMTIPPNRENGKEIRPARPGPVFSVDPDDGHLHMRYSARARNVIWRNDPMTMRATDRLRELMEDNSPFVYRVRLEPGMGVFSNNVLHNRSGFEDGDDQSGQRLIYRARYYQRIATGN